MTRSVSTVFLGRGRFTSACGVSNGSVLTIVSASLVRRQGGHSCTRFTRKVGRKRVVLFISEGSFPILPIGSRSVGVGNGGCVIGRMSSGINMLRVALAIGAGEKVPV